MLLDSPQFSHRVRACANALLQLEIRLGAKTLDASDPEFGDFNEWYINDFAPADGQRLIDRFAAESGAQLPVAEAELLAAWRTINR